MSFKLKHSLSILIIFLVLLKSAGWAKVDRGQSPNVDPDFMIFDGNRIQLQLSNNGSLAGSDQGGPAVYWPGIESGENVAYYAGIWVAGKVENEYRTACAEGASEWRPGPVLKDGTADNPYDPQHRIYKIEKISPMSTDWVEWPTEHGAPWIDRNDDGFYDPYSGDQPAILGDQMLWYVANDLDQANHDAKFLTEPLGLECQVQMWGSNRQDYLGDAIFARVKIMNKGNVFIDSCYIGFFVNVEIGDELGDLIGSDTTTAMMFAYDDAVDEIWGDYSPAIGVSLLQGAQISSIGDTVHSIDASYEDKRDLGLASAIRMDYGGPYGLPKDAAECYNVMSGKMKSGELILNPITAEPSFPVKYATGDPEKGTGWLDAIDRLSFDRKILMSTGPFTFAPQDTQDVIIAILVAQAESPLASVTLLKENARKIQSVYRSGFDVVEAPPKPKMQISAMDRKILISWDGSAEMYQATDKINLDEFGNPSQYQFQGYNVYQLETDEGLGVVKRIATFDQVDGITQIEDLAYIESIGEEVEHTVQFGSDQGVQRYLLIDHDYLRDIPLVNHRPYYFAVTAYGYNPYGIPKVLESAVETVLSIMPRESEGMEYNTTIYDSLEVMHSGMSQGEVLVYVLDPGAVTGHDYEVQFNLLDSTKYVWSLVDVTNGEVVLADQENQSGDNAYSIVDGLLIKVEGPEPGIDWSKLGIDPAPKGSQVEYYGWGVAGYRWISGYDLSDQIENTGMGGGLFTARDYFGYTANRYVNIRLDFSLDPGPDSSNWSRAYVIREDLNFEYDGIGWFPGKLWNGSKQLNIAFVENNMLVPSNHVWDMGWDEKLGNYSNGGVAGNHEIIFLLESSYDGGLNAAIAEQDWKLGEAIGVMYAIWPEPNKTVAPYSGDFSIYIYAAKQNTDMDVYSFSTEDIAPIQDVTIAKNDIQRINVFPNPYLGGQVEERHALDRFVRFTHLPENSTIRIYSLLGDLVRKIEHTNVSPYEEWDLRNEYNIPVASGLYLVHVDCGKLGKKVLKLAIVLSEEQLSEF